MSERVFDLEERLVDFSSGIIDVVEALPDSRAIECFLCTSIPKT